MAKPKLKARPAAPEMAESGPSGKSIMDSAQQIWLAGLGAFSKAQAGGGKLFESLMKEGSGLEQLTRKIAGGKVEEVREAVESGVSQVRERTQETWDRLEQVFEKRVSHALKALGVPGRKDLEELLKRFDELNREVKKLMPSLPKVNFTRTFTSTIRRSKDDLSDLVKDIEDVQLAAKQASVRPQVKVRPMPPPPPPKTPAKPAPVPASVAKPVATKSTAKPAPKPAAKAAPKVVAKPAPKATTKPQAKAKKPAPKAVVKAAAKPAAKPSKKVAAGKAVKKLPASTRKKR